MRRRRAAPPSAARRKSCRTFGAAARSGFAAAALLVFSGFHPEPAVAVRPPSAARLPASLRHFFWRAALVPPWSHDNCRHYFRQAALVGLPVLLVGLTIPILSDAEHRDLADAADDHVEDAQR